METHELDAFADALDDRPPDQGTACDAWTVHELTAHLVAGGEEMVRHLEPALNGDPIPTTRSFEEREAPFRAMDDAALRRRFHENMPRLIGLLEAALDNDPDATVPWTGRTVPLRYFATHIRSEAALHRWDMVGDDEISADLLGQQELLAHAVGSLGPLLVLGGGDEPFEGRLRSSGLPDVVVRVEASGRTVTLEEPEDEAAPALWSDAAARLLLVWGRRPGDPSRLRSTLEPDQLGRLRSIFAGL